VELNLDDEMQTLLGSVWIEEGFVRRGGSGFVRIREDV